MTTSSLAKEWTSSAANSSIDAAQVDAVLAHTLVANVVSTLAALALAIYLTPIVGTTVASAWFALKVASALPCAAFAQGNKRGPGDGGGTRFESVLFGMLAIDGAVWGLVGAACATQVSETAAGLLLACLSSVAMLAAFGLQVRVRATAAFVLPIMVPLTVALAFRGDALGAIGAAGALLVLAQTLVGAFASERRVSREQMAHQCLERALAERSEALDLASHSLKELEQALVQVQRQAAVKALFLGTMSHELRTPLHGILGLTELVQRRSSDPKVSHHLDLIRSSGTHLLELIGALLDVSRIDAGRLEMHPAPLDLAVDARNMADLYELRAEAKGICFRARLDLGESCWIRADAARLRQILHNLLGNAMKFTVRGSVEFSVSRDGRMFHFDVRDTGPGIAGDELPRIFEAFTQAGGNAARPSDGTGLGLTIARELARAMRGDITVESTVGVGSRFHFAAPLETVLGSEIPRPALGDAGTRSVLRPGCKVLLVEDNDVNALIAHAHLESLGAHVVRAHDGRQGVEAATAPSRPDLVLMDCRMPVLDGIAATRLIRSWEAATGATRLPIVALTATPSPSDRDECIAAGMDGLLGKPFTDRQLIELIDHHVGDSDPAARGAEPPLPGVPRPVSEPLTL